MAISLRVLAVGAMLWGAMTGIAAAETDAAAVHLDVYKSPTCGCCSKWADHLRENGFTVTTRDMEDVGSVKSELGVPSDLGSCHTAVVEGYVVEGHVPADVIARLLDERPEVAGIAVPGMPRGSPGMEAPVSDPYNVMTFDLAGNRTVYERR